MRRIALSAAGLTVSIIAIGILVSSVDLGRTAQAIGTVHVAPLIPVIVLVAVGIVLRSWRWQRLLPGAGSVPVRRIVPVVLIGYLGNSVLPARLGEPIRAYLLARREALRFASVFGSALLERMVDLTVLAMMALAAAVALGAPAWSVQLLALVSLGGLTGIAALAIFGLEPSLRFIHGFVRRWGGRLDRAFASLESFAGGVGGPSRRRPLLSATGISVLIWLADGSICWLVAASFGMGFSLPAAVLVVGIGGLGTSIPSAPGYIGTYELAMSTMARTLGAPASDALGFALVLHAITLIPVATGGIVSLWAVGGEDLWALAHEAQSEGAGPR